MVEQTTATRASPSSAPSSSPPSPPPPSLSPSSQGTAWEILVKRAILGSGVGEGDGSSCASCTSAASQVVEDLMRELESWSLELQRHCPQDWNECSAVLVQCVTGRSRRRAAAKFRV